MECAGTGVTHGEFRLRLPYATHTFTASPPVQEEKEGKDREESWLGVKTRPMPGR